MPVVTTTAITRADTLVECLANILENDVSLGVRHIAKYDEYLTPEYPAVLIQPGQITKEIHGTATWLHGLRASIFVMHSLLTISKQQRSLEDCQLAGKIIDALEADKTLGRRIIFGFVESEEFAPLPPRSQKSSAVVSTRLQWFGTSESRFR